MINSCSAAARALVLSFGRSCSLKERLRIGAFCFCSAVVFVQPLWAHEFAVGSIEIEHPWSRAVPNGAKVAAGYLTLSNEGSVPDRLVAATAEIAGRVEIHEMAVDGNGVMTMRPLAQGLEVPAGGEVALQPGSFHIMFLDLKAPPEAGKPFKGTLTFAKAGTVAVEYAVEPLGGGAQGHSSMNQGE